MPAPKDQPTQTVASKAGAIALTTSELPQEPKPQPALGTVVNVKVAEGMLLMNNELGIHFEADKVTPITVTVTTLRRLQDGDLVLQD